MMLVNIKELSSRLEVILNLTTLGNEYQKSNFGLYPHAACLFNC